MLNFWVKKLRIFTYFYVFIIPSNFFKCFGFPETYLYVKISVNMYTYIETLVFLGETIHHTENRKQKK